jgi:hypothetical protein
MSLVENYHAAHKARLARMGAPVRYQAPVVRPKPVIQPQAYDAGWDGMWFFDLVTCEYRGSKSVLVRDVQTAVCDHFGVELAELLSARKTKNLAVVRHIAYYLSKTLTPKSLPDIGRRFGRDHTTILYGVRKIGIARRFDSQINTDIRAISLKLGAA